MKKMLKKGFRVLISFVLIMSVLYSPYLSEENVQAVNTWSFVNSSTGKNGSIQNWTAPQKGKYKIEANGAQGGNSGGLGAYVSGEFVLEKGQVLNILVGQQGTGSLHAGPGGGGGTYVVDGVTPLLVAAGGGGSGCNGEPLTNAHGKGTYATSTDGGLAYDGAGGSGFVGNGQGTANANGGLSYLNGGTGGAAVDASDGGFGGGGSGFETKNCRHNGAGGGGGYFGGNGSVKGESGEGGYSYNIGMNKVSTTGAKAGHGDVVITLLPSDVNLLTPNNLLITGDSTIDMAWEPKDGFTLEEYELRIGTFSGGSNIYLGSQGTNTNYIFNVPNDLLNDVTYYWSVRGRNAAGWGNWSIERSFKFVTPKAIPSKPTDGLKVLGGSIMLEWIDGVASDTNISQYELRAGSISGGSDIIAPVLLTGNSYEFKIPTNLPNNTTIYWQVRAQDNLGYWGAWREKTILYANTGSIVEGNMPLQPETLSLDLNNRLYEFSISRFADQDSANYSMLYVDLVDSSGNVVVGSKQQIVLEQDLTGNHPQLIKDGSEKDGAMQGAFDLTTMMNLKLKFEPNEATQSYSLTLVKSDNTTEVLKTGEKIIKNKIFPNALETYTLRIYAEEYLNTSLPQDGAINNTLTTSSLSKTINIDTRNNLPIVENITSDINGRIFSESSGFDKITINGDIKDDPATSNVTVYYEIQEKSESYTIEKVLNASGVYEPKNGIKSGTFSPVSGVINSSFEFTYLVDHQLTSGDWSVLIYGVDEEGNFGYFKEVPFKVDWSGSRIDFIASYIAADGTTVTMSTSEKQIISPRSKVKIFFTPNNYETIEYSVYLIQGMTIKPLKIKGAFTSEIKSSFIGLNLDVSQVITESGEITSYQLGDRIVVKLKAETAKNIKTIKDVRILIGDEMSSFDVLSDANMPIIP